MCPKNSLLAFTYFLQHPWCIFKQGLHSHNVKRIYKIQRSSFETSKLELSLCKSRHHMQKTTYSQSRTSQFHSCCCRNIWLSSFASSPPEPGVTNWSMSPFVTAVNNSSMERIKFWPIRASAKIAKKNYNRAYQSGKFLNF